MEGSVTSPNTGPMTSPNHISIFVFIDALGWEIAQRCRFMEDQLTTRAPLGTIFGYSSTCDPTILTGKLPRDHGHFAFYYHNPEASPFRRYKPLRWLPRSVMNRGRVRGKISQYLKKLHGFTGYFQLYNMPFEHLHLFDYSERNDIFRPGGINSGIPTIFQTLDERNIPYALVNDYMRSEEQNLQTLENAIATGEPVLAYILLGKLDALLHQFGSRAPQIDQHLNWYAERLSRLVARAEDHYPEVRLFVFSDHGMTDIHDACDLKSRIEALGLTFGSDYTAVYDSTMARFWFMNENARARVTTALEQEPKGHIMSSAELAEFGCDFPGQKFGQLFFLMNPGVLLCPSFMGEKPLAGMHGYDPRHPDSIASFLSNVQPEPFPKRLDNLYALMLNEAANAGTAA